MLQTGFSRGLNPDVMGTPLPFDKIGGWMVVVVTDTKGRITAHPIQGRDKDIAFQAVKQQHPVSGGLSLVYWEKGFASLADAEMRVAGILQELGAKQSLTGSKPH